MPLLSETRRPSFQDDLELTTLRHGVPVVVSDAEPHVGGQSKEVLVKGVQVRRDALASFAHRCQYAQLADQRPTSALNAYFRRFRVAYKRLFNPQMAFNIGFERSLAQMPGCRTLENV